MQKRIFLGSSSEAYPLVEGIESVLNEFKVGISVDKWRLIFQPTDNILERLIQALPTYSYAVFIYGPDDTIIIKGIEQSIARDNVIFESGLAMSVLGKKRTLIIVPKTSLGQLKQRVASDLDGLVYLSYDVPQQPDLKQDQYYSIEESSRSIAKGIMDVILKQQEADEAESWRWAGDWVGILNQTSGMSGIRVHASFAKFGDIWEGKLLLLPQEARDNIPPGHESMEIALKGHALPGRMLRFDYKYIKPSSVDILGSVILQVHTEIGIVTGIFIGCGLLDQEMRSGSIKLHRDHARSTDY